MWRDIESSKLWGRFYQAAEAQDYVGLLELSVMFDAHYIHLFGLLVTLSTSFSFGGVGEE
jgi:hypothetical protein